MSNARQHLVVLDVEGVLTPEIWVALADHFDIEALRRTTQHEPNYQKLMDGRIAALNEHNVCLSDIQGVIAGLEPLAGSKEFLDELRSMVQVVLLSDTFEQYIAPMMAMLGQPTILCHRLDVVDDCVVRFEPRIADPKRCAVEAFQSLNYRVSAAGDSFNDLSMIDKADSGFLFRAPERIRVDRSDLQAFDDYADLLAAFRSVIAD